MVAARLDYYATNIAQEFHADNSEVCVLFGPVGCGKSVANCIQVFARAIQQEPGRDGVRRSRWAIVRNTYPELKATTIKTWTAWFPEDVFGKIKYDSPIVQHIKQPLEDGTFLDLEVFFLALDSPKDIKKLKSFELTGAYINEMQFIDEDIFLTCRERTNRYPAKKEGVSPTWTGVIADANPPSTQHWMYDTFEKSRPKNYRIFKYAPAVLRVDEIPKGTEYAVSRNDSIYINNPDADYRFVQNDPNYWLRLVQGNDDEKIKVDLMGEYGVVISGKPVHPTYNDSLHFAKRTLQYNPELELGLAFDFGLTPACAITQLTSRGKFEVLDEIWATHMGLRDFLSNLLIPHLGMKYPEWKKNYSSVHDPAGGSASQTDGLTCAEILEEFGILSEPAAENNDPTLRRDGLKYFLGKMVDGQPAFAVSDKCPMIREGLMGHFQYARIQAGGDARYREKPLKNIYSHICEALEYRAIRYSSEHRDTKQEKPETESYRIMTGNFMGL